MVSEFLFHPPKRFVTAVAALGLSLAVANPPLALAGHRDGIEVPAMPPDLVVPDGNEPYLVGHARGTQNYLCSACPNAITPAEKCPASGFAWAFIGPQATLFDVDDGDDEQIITHFNSSNPEEAGRERPTWQSSRDSSAVWANNSAPPAVVSTDAEFVAKDAIPWLRLPKAGTQVGPTGGGKLTKTTFVQRLKTVGGVAPPPDTCAAPTDAGKKALVPYSADYIFYKASN